MQLLSDIFKCKRKAIWIACLVTHTHDRIMIELLLVDPDDSLYLLSTDFAVNRVNIYTHR